MERPDERITVVLGASPLPHRYANIAVRRLRAAGHSVVAVGRHAGAIGDVTIQPTWPEGIRVDTVTLYLNPLNQEPWSGTIIVAAPRRIIMNPGTENPNLAERARAAGIEVVEACTLVMLSTGQY